MKFQELSLTAEWILVDFQFANYYFFHFPFLFLSKPQFVLLLGGRMLRTRFLLWIDLLDSTSFRHDGIDLDLYHIPLSFLSFVLFR